MIQLVLLFAILMNGLLAGIFFIWTNTITPGIGNLEDSYYLKSFQSMNRTILNPLFFIVFFAPFILSLVLSIWCFSSELHLRFILSALAFVFYGIGVIAITFLGNIPLNDKLDHLQIDKMTDDNLLRFRLHFESRWNNLHLIRTVTSTLSFLFLIIAALWTS